MQALAAARPPTVDYLRGVGEAVMSFVRQFLGFFRSGDVQQLREELRKKDEELEKKDEDLRKEREENEINQWHWWVRWYGYRMDLGQHGTSHTSTTETSRKRTADRSLSGTTKRSRPLTRSSGYGSKRTQRLEEPLALVSAQAELSTTDETRVAVELTQLFSTCYTVWDGVKKKSARVNEKVLVHPLYLVVCLRALVDLDDTFKLVHECPTLCKDHAQQGTGVKPCEFVFNPEDPRTGFACAFRHKIDEIVREFFDGQCFLLNDVADSGGRLPDMMIVKGYPFAVNRRSNQMARNAVLTGEWKGSMRRSGTEAGSQMTRDAMRTFPTKGNTVFTCCGDWGTTEFWQFDLVSPYDSLEFDPSKDPSKTNLTTRRGTVHGCTEEASFRALAATIARFARHAETKSWTAERRFAGRNVVLHRLIAAPSDRSAVLHGKVTEFTDTGDEKESYEGVIKCVIDKGRKRAPLEVNFWSYAYGKGREDRLKELEQFVVVPTEPKVTDRVLFFPQQSGARFGPLQEAYSAFRDEGFADKLLAALVRTCCGLWALGFTHGDIHDGNCLVQATKDNTVDVRLIDMETARPNGQCSDVTDGVWESASAQADEIRRWWFDEATETSIKEDRRVLDALCIWMTVLPYALNRDRGEFRVLRSRSPLTGDSSSQTGDCPRPPGVLHEVTFDKEGVELLRDVFKNVSANAGSKGDLDRALCKTLCDALKTAKEGASSSQGPPCLVFAASRRDAGATPALRRVAPKRPGRVRAVRPAP